MKSRLGYFCGTMSWGGLEMNHLKAAKWMKKRGHEVVVLAQSASPIYENARQASIETIAVRRHRKYYDINAAWRLAKIIKNQQITHLLLRDTKDISVAVLAKRLSMSSVHLSYFMAMQIGVPKRDLLHTLRYRGLDLWSCPLDSLAQQVKTMTRMPHNRIKIIPDGIELERFINAPSQTIARSKLNLPLEANIIGIIGRFDPQKRQLLLLEAFKLLKDQNLAICLLGEPTKGEKESEDYLTEIQKEVIDNGWENQIFIRPFRKDVETFYAAIDLLVMASKAETFGMVTVEAMAAGKPVIASNAGGSPELLKHGQIGYLFETGDALSLAQKIQQWLNDKSKFSKKSIQEAVQQFDHEYSCSVVEKNLGLKKREDS